MEDLLPSDARFRLDRNLFIENKLEAADEAKIALEQAQRREEDLRKGKKPSVAGKAQGEGSDGAGDGEAK
jgi:hypothetical protein